MRCSLLRWPMTGSTAARRRKARLIAVESPRFPRHVDPEPALLRGMMALVAGIGDDPGELGSNRRLDGGDHGGQRMPVIRIAGQRFDMRHELPAPAAVERRRDAHLDAELVG